MTTDPAEHYRSGAYLGRSMRAALRRRLFRAHPDSTVRVMGGSSPTALCR